ncbi:Helicase associated domain protein [Aldersonia sp. NBC_00410]|nr:Helicase associated domain protein [Aldersonia sp. NBC_00410]
MLAPRHHQVAALDALRTTLTDSTRRAQLVMPCGSGKTLIGRWFAEQSRAAVTVVVMPTLGLVAQTLQEWKSTGDWFFEALITCSDPATAEGERERAGADGADVPVPFWAAHRARVTTSSGVVAQRLAGHSPDRPLVIFSTYHSAHVVASAVRSAGVVVDLIIADEAHHLAGRPNKTFRCVLDEGFAARKRVFMTATPVTASAAADGADVDDRSAPLSMDDRTMFGPVAYRLDLGSAIDMGLLSDYQVVVFEATGEGFAPDAVSALSAAAREGLHRVLSFHGRVSKAREFAASVDGVRLPDGRRVVARAVAGTDKSAARTQALALLTTADPDELVVVASARCLSEGIDIPAVDGVLFADPKGSDVDIVQSVGRALRTAVGKRDGVVMIPVCIPPELDEDTALSTGSFAAVWRILRGLRSADPRLTTGLKAFARDPSRRGTRDGSRPPRIRFDVDAVAVDRLVARMVDFTSASWDSKFSELVSFVTGHGHARPPAGTALGMWCARQRSAYQRRMLPDDHARALRSLPGWAWDLSEQRWVEQWSQVHTQAVRAGGLRLTDPDFAATALVPREPRCTVSTVGRWCAWQRQLARHNDLDQWRRTKLEEIPGWRWRIGPAGDAAAVDLLGEYVAWKGHANPPADFVEDDIALGRWLNEVRRQRATDRLPQPLLDEITLVCPSSGAGALQWYRGETLWLLGLEALRQFASREGHSRVPCQHDEELVDTTVQLYAWCTRQRHLYRHGQLIEVRARMVAAVRGWQWERQPAPRVLLDIGDARHGSRTGYVKGCRCDECTKANTQEAAERAARAAAGVHSTDWVDARRARGRLRVMAGQGAQQKVLARAAGVNVKTIQGLLSGTTMRIHPETEERVCALTMADVRAAAEPGTYVDAGPTWVLLDDMIGRGWPKSWIAHELGHGTGLQMSHGQVTAGNATRVAELAARLGDLTPPPRSGRRATPPLNEILAALGERDEEVA